MFWQNRNSELYGSGGGSPRRSSIERLQKASRVKNSNILALEQKQEYDPTRIHKIERPLSKVQDNVFGSPASFRSSISGRPPAFGHHRSESKTALPTMSPPPKSPVLQTAGSPTRPWTPSRDQVSPTKSSLSSRFKTSFDLETGTWTGDSPIHEDDLPSGRTLHRHAKSVTFDAAPPQINEYEMATPSLSSIGTNSREGSFESMDDDEDDMLYDPEHINIQDDSFDASLEDTDKTPVVGPDDWRGDSPVARRNSGPQQFESSPMPENSPATASMGRPLAKRTDSSTSNGEHRPLPPLPPPGLGEYARSQSGRSSPVSPGLSATAERMLNAQRNLPPPPPASTTSKTDIQHIGTNKMSLEERLKLMMLSDDNDGKTAAVQQRERRLRRAKGHERLSSPATASEPDSVVSGPEDLEDDDTIGDISGLDEYRLPPKISRESIMRRVNGNKSDEGESDYIFSSPPRSPSQSPERVLPLDPDVPIPSTERDDPSEDEDELSEVDEGSVIITRQPEDDYDDEDDVLDFYQDSDAENDEPEAPASADDSGSHYSEQEPAQPEHLVKEPVVEALVNEPIAEATTPRATTPTPVVTSTSFQGSLLDLGRESSENSFSRDLESYMISEPEKPKEATPEAKEAQSEMSKLEEARAFLQRPFTPEQLMSKPEYDGSGWGEDEFEEEPGTPESVIHHPMSAEEDTDESEVKEPKESPAIPERQATIRAPGTKLKTRVSNTPSDLAAMREARRQVSVEIPDVPTIPDRLRKRLSKDQNPDLLITGDEFLDRHPSFKNRSLTLDLDLGLSLDQDFERVIAAQKVIFDSPTLEQSLRDNQSPTRQASTKLTQPDIKGLNANITSRPQRGYLMRQNTKLVTASDRDRVIDKDSEDYFVARSAGNSPVKMDRPQSWTVEPWNGRPRQRSMRKRGVMSTGPVPPMPGQESNAMAFNQVIEEDYSADMATAESGERGRLFVKVMGVKDLDLPLPKSMYCPP